ncbi:SdpI family protein [Caproiciproducens faecalis]|uniref:SdpI family protein n=1 Tax=Caproiciproducens faecalis TaxID=2820301 RepID=A0ABS7DKJ7_9FIRM|nr:SdpI family protein [Caproiciproducens faecalis]MBW7571819.1 SdpI family protein [Caproiciproducens faecalis]
MKNKIGKYLYWLAAVFPFLLSAAFYSRLPETMPTHWDAAGNVNGYSSRFFAAFGIPAILLACGIFVNFSISADPKRQNIDRSPQMKLISRWLVVIIANVTQASVIAKVLYKDFNISVLITALVGIVIAVLGNYLPKCKPNYTMGIKLPWTLASEENWRKTHRFAGFVWIVGGVVIIISAFLPYKALLLAAILLLSVIPAIYSYCLFRKEKN